MKVLTAAQMREVDRLTTERFGVPSLKLMENAGTRVVEVLREVRPGIANDRVMILCGKGNNGGDGFVVARLLKQLGCSPEVFLFATPESVKGDAAVNLRRWQEAGTVRLVADAAAWETARAALASANVIVDALLGTGLTGPVEGLLRGVIEDVNRARERALVVAVDIPSGLPSDTGAPMGPAVHAHHTVTFTAPKLGLILPPNCESVGRMIVGHIGTPRELLDDNAELKFHWLEPQEFRSFPVHREPGAHKGDYGHALIFAGSRGKTGAAVLAAWGALRAGAGLVTVATPASILPIVATALPEMMTEALQGTDVESIAASNLDYGRLESLTSGKSVVAIGPGLSTHVETQQFVRAVLAQCKLPIILDADGLNAYAGRAVELKACSAGGLAITPHPGEMARLRNCTTAAIQSRRFEVALESAVEWNACVVLKGFRTIVACPDGTAFINSTGNPGMATGGTGDVLTGILAGLTAQFGGPHAKGGLQRWSRLLALGVYLHGRAGDLAAAETGEASLMASDLVHMIPRAYAELLSQLQTDGPTDNG
jgi:NAD(P)H-hydrate epimerase